LANGRTDRGKLLAAQLLDLLDLERELLERPRDHTGQEVDDQDLHRGGEQAEDHQELVVALELGGEVRQRRHGEELPFLAELGRQGGQAREILAAAMAERERSLAAAWTGGVRHGGQLVVERADVAKLELATLAAIGLGKVRRRQHAALAVENVGER